MRIFIVPALMLLTAASAGATTYTIDLKAAVGGSEEVKRSVTVSDGQIAALMLDGVAVRVMPVPADDGSVRLRTEIFEKNRMGLKLLSKPSVVTQLNQTAVINEQGAREMRFELTPKVIASAAPPDQPLKVMGEIR